MAQDAPTTIAPGTIVTSDNWPDLQRRGLVHLTNTDDETDLREPEMTDLILRWELGGDRVFSGWAFIEGMPQDPEGPSDYHRMTGFYIIRPSDRWPHPWIRMVYDTHPKVIAAGIQHLLEPQPDITTRWSIWAVVGSPGQFRCWGPNTNWDTKFQGTFDEVAVHIKQWESEHGQDY